MEIKSILDALINLEDIVNNTELDAVKVEGYLKNYLFVGKVLFPIIPNTEITGESLKLNIDSEHENAFADSSILSDDFWKEYFIKIDDLFSTYSPKVKTLDEDASFLTSDYIENNTVADGHALSFNMLSTTKNYTQEDFEKRPSLAIPLSNIEEIVPRFTSNQPIAMNLEKVDVIIDIDNSSIKIYDEKLILDNFNYENFVFINRNINNISGQLDLARIRSSYLQKGSSIEPTVEVPEEADTNIAIFKDLLGVPYLKAGDKVLLKVQSFQDIDTLNTEIENHFSQNPNDIFFENNYLVSKDNLDAVISKIISYYSIV